MPKPLFNDPLVDEVHETRERLLAECGGDLDRLMDRLQSREQEDGSRVVRDVREFRPLTGNRS
jgi:hypothetical protein